MLTPNKFGNWDILVLNLAVAMIDQIPDIILLHIFAHLEPIDLSRASQVCRNWYSTIENDDMWYAAFKHRWGEDDANSRRWKRTGTSWRQEYLDRVQRLSPWAGKLSVPFRRKSLGGSSAFDQHEEMVRLLVGRWSDGNSEGGSVFSTGKLLGVGPSSKLLDNDGMMKKTSAAAPSTVRLVSKRAILNGRIVAKSVVGKGNEKKMGQMFGRLIRHVHYLDRCFQQSTITAVYMNDDDEKKTVWFGLENGNLVWVQKPEAKFLTDANPIYGTKPHNLVLPAVQGIKTTQKGGVKFILSYHADLYRESYLIVWIVSSNDKSIIQNKENSQVDSMNAIKPLWWTKLDYKPTYYTILNEAYKSATDALGLWWSGNEDGTIFFVNLSHLAKQERPNELIVEKFPLARQIFVFTKESNVTVEAQFLPIHWIVPTFTIDSTEHHWKWDALVGHDCITGNSMCSQVSYNTQLDTLSIRSIPIPDSIVKTFVQPLPEIDLIVAVLVDREDQLWQLVINLNDQQENNRQENWSLQAFPVLFWAGKEDRLLELQTSKIYAVSIDRARTIVMVENFVAIFDTVSRDLIQLQTGPRIDLHFVKKTNRRRQAARNDPLIGREVGGEELRLVQIYGSILDSTLDGQILVQWIGKLIDQTGRMIEKEIYHLWSFGMPPYSMQVARDSKKSAEDGPSQKSLLIQQAQEDYNEWQDHQFDSEYGYSEEEGFRYSDNPEMAKKHKEYQKKRNRMLQKRYMVEGMNEQEMIDYAIALSLSAADDIGS